MPGKFIERVEIVGPAKVRGVSPGKGRDKEPVKNKVPGTFSRRLSENAG
jgi:hypothetical protein